MATENLVITTTIVEIYETEAKKVEDGSTACGLNTILGSLLTLDPDIPERQWGFCRAIPAERRVEFRRGKAVETSEKILQLRSRRKAVERSVFPGFSTQGTCNAQAKW